MPNWIGDLVMATPVLAALKKAYPEAKLTAMVRNPLGDLLTNDPYIDELFCFDKPRGFARRDAQRDIVGKIAQGKYDLGVLLTNSFSSAWWFWQGKITRRLGYSTQWRSLLLTDRPALPKKIFAQHLVQTYQQLLFPLGIRSQGLFPKLYLREQEVVEARKLLKDFGVNSPETPLIGINPGAAYGSAKCWLPERFREVAVRLLKETKAMILFFGDRSGVPLVKEICRDLPGRVINLAGITSLRELMALVDLCDVLLTNDSGPMHIADALNTEVVAIFGSTDPKVTGPYRKGVVINKQVQCSPCFKRTCPIDFRCMKEITTNEVVNALLASIQDKIPKLASPQGLYD
ncbi:MAG: lipopolysaccharide heptosyltransferase II [Anaplasmataceae bacterium]|nr:lipopolysaccharide heptosyltransferase II [Anaplasmataceae bacterium]